MNHNEIKKSKFIEEINKGGTLKEIASRLGISTTILKEGIKFFNIDLKAKTKAYVFIDDTIDTREIIENINSIGNSIAEQLI